MSHWKFRCFTVLVYQRVWFGVIYKKYSVYHNLSCTLGYIYIYRDKWKYTHIYLCKYTHILHHVLVYLNLGNVTEEFVWHVHSFSMIAKRLCHCIFIQACDRGKYSSLFDIFYQKCAEITSFSVGGQCFKWCHGYYFHYCTYACFCQHKSLLTLTSDPTNAATSNAQCYIQHTHEHTIRHFHARRTSNHTIPIRFLFKVIQLSFESTVASFISSFWKKKTHNPKVPKQFFFPFGWFPKQTKNNKTPTKNNQQNQVASISPPPWVVKR